MGSLRTAVLIGTASLALAGAAGIAWAEAPRGHVLTIQLPGGAVERIRYSGDVAPRVTLTDGAPVTGGILFTPLAPISVFDTAFGSDSPFAMFDRIAAEMDQRTHAMLREATTGGARSPGAVPTLTGLGALPTGAAGHYSFVSTTSGSGKGFCTQSVQITARGDGKAPQVVRQSSGDCGGGAASGTPALLKDAPTAPSGVTQASLKADRAAPPAPHITT